MYYLTITPLENNDANNTLISEIAVKSVHSAIMKGQKLYLTLPWVALHPEYPRLSLLRIIRIFSEDRIALEEVAEVFRGFANAKIEEYKHSKDDRFFIFSNKRLLTPSRIKSLQKRDVKRRDNKNRDGVIRKAVTDIGLAFIHTYSSTSGKRIPLNIEAKEHKTFNVSGRTSSYGLATREPGNIVSLPIFE